MIRAVAVAVVVVVLTLGQGGCSGTRWGVDRAAEVVRQAAPAFREEPDVAFAREAMAGQVKLVEGLLRVSPRNPILLEQAAEGFCGYAHLFVEDDLEALPQLDENRAVHARRAAGLYARCRDHALRRLELRHPGFREALAGPLDRLDAALARTGAEDVPGLFWLGFSLAASANVGREDVAVVADLPRAEAVLQRAAVLDERYANAGARLVLGAVLASRGKLIGGDPERGRREIERAIELTGGVFLMHRVVLARTYAVAVGDRELYLRELQTVVKTPAAVMPAERLSNEVARRRAARYLELADELF